ncbi:MAG TPA: hypothetical protein VJV75_01485, partial [Candidatus Polarisedimenticolia bacterium]|nr:hypothetical protein [Candidatus Polarisedimenticolia bacterium]
YALMGGLGMKVSEDGRVVTFRTAADWPIVVLRLLGLADEDGRAGDARWERVEPPGEDGTALRLVLDPGGLRFPITARALFEVGKRSGNSPGSPARADNASAAPPMAQPVPAAAPTNDTCDGGEVLPGAGPFPAFSSVVDLTDATTTGDPPAPACQPDVTRSVWYRFTPAVTGAYDIAVCTDAGTATTLEDTVVAIYASTGACAGLTSLPGGCDDDSCGAAGLQSRLAGVPLAAGVTYHVVVWSFGAVAPPAGEGDVQLRVDFAPGGMPPDNDRCEGAETIPAAGPFPWLSGVIPDISAATLLGDPSPPSCQPNVSRSVWYRFTPATPGRYNFSVCADGPTGTTVDDTVLAVYASNGDCSGFDEMPGGCDDDSCAGEPAQSVSVGVPLLAGVVYDVVVWKYGSAPPAAGDTALQLRVDRVAGPSNDTCAGAAPLLLDAPVSGTTALALDDTRLPAASTCFQGVGQTPSQAAGRDVAYRFTAPEGGSYSFRVSGYPIPGNLAIYAAADCPAGPGPALVTTCLGAANRSATQPEEIACLALAAGQTITVYVDEDSTTAGGGFTIEANRCVWEGEPDDAPATAAPLVCFTEGGIRPAADADFFALGSPESGSRVFAIADGAAANSGDLDLRVTTAADTLECDDFNNDAPFGATCPNVAGTPLNGAPAFLRLSHYSASAQSEPYRLCAAVQPPAARAIVEVEPDDTPASATAAAAGWFAGALSGAADVDLFGFDAAAGDLVMIGLDLDPLRNNTPWNGWLAILDPAGATLLVVNDPSSASSTLSGAGSLAATSPSSPGETLLYRVRSAGIYYAKVGWSSGIPGDYLLSIARNGHVGGDGDGDGHADSGDCAPADPAAWAVPGEATGLVLQTGGPATLLTWSPPVASGGSSIRYDLLRSTRADDFSAATCLLSNATVTSTTDPELPASAFFYLVRAGNPCGGNLGRRSDGTPRSAPTCP